MNGIAGILDLEMVRHVLNISDGNWKRVNLAEEYDQQLIDDLAAIMSVEKMKKAVTVAVATKS